MTVFSGLKDKLKEQKAKSDRIHTNAGSGQMPSTRGGAGNLGAGVGADNSDLKPEALDDETKKLPDHTTDENSGAVKQDGQ